jgi:phage/plasmid-associated DNA primase
MKIKINQDATGKNVKKIYADTKSFEWDKWSYEKCMAYNNNNNHIKYRVSDTQFKLIKKSSCKNIQINLNQSKYMIIDLDDKETIAHYLDKYGDINKTLSSSKKLPHLWKLKNKDDKNITNKLHWKKGVDLIYKNVFEKLDSQIYNYNIEEMKTFNDYPQPKEKKLTKLTIKKKIIKNQDNCDIDYSDNEIIDLLHKLPENYILEHEYWLKTATAMKSIDKVDLFLDYCLKHEKTKCKKIGDMYYNKNIELINNIKDHNELNMIGHLYKQIQDPNKIPSIDNSDFGLATLYLDLTKDSIVKHQGNLYVYQKPYWKVDKKKLFIKKDVRNVLQSYLKSLRFKIQKICSQNSDEDKADKLTTHLINVNNAISSIGRVSKIDNIVKAIDIEIDEHDYRFDLINKNIFCFNDKAFDIYANKEVNIEKYDYITQNTNYDYQVVSQEDIDYISTWIKKIMPNDNKRITFISILKSALSGNQQPYFNLFNGGGCNGKGTILELMSELMGEYYLNGNVDLLLQSFNSKGASESLVGLDKKRLVVFSEPSECKKICSDVMKVITDTPSLQARGLYEDLRDIFFTGTYVMECNSRPAIKGRNDNSLLRRVIDIEFESTFTNDKELLKLENHYEQNTYYKSQEFKDKYKIALFHYLLNEGKDKIEICKEVQERSYEYLMDNDSLVEFFKINCEITTNMNDIYPIKEFYKLFKIGSFYNSLDKEQKRVWGINHFTEQIKNNNYIKKFYRDRVQTKTQNVRRVLQGVRVTNQTDDFIDC